MSLRTTLRIPVAGMGASVLALSLSASPAPAADVVAEAISGGDAHLQSRLRYEEASVEDNANDDATALTLRTRLGYTTAPLAGFTGMMEVEDVRTVGNADQYAPVQPDHDIIADPPVTELNQAYLTFDGITDLAARYGRQRIILDNARFIGNVGWRQDEQTFDGTRADYDHEHVHATLAWLTAVNGITPAFDANVSNALANLRWKTAPGGALTAYGYFLEDDTSSSELDTLGARYDGSAALDPVKLLLTLEYATQEADNNANEPEAEYRLVEAGINWRAVTLKLGQEVLGSDDGNYGFQTPLATKHAFNGWADKFLSTPDAGLEDGYVMLGGTLAGVALKAFYHEFSAEEGNADFGTETDLLASRSFGEHYKAGIKYADYRADDFGTDTQKAWVWGEFNF